MAWQLTTTPIGKVGPWAVDLPIISIGPSPPFLGIAATVHGDEPGGLFTIDRLLRMLEVRASRRGIVVFPVTNPLAMIRRARLSMHDDLDLNRCSVGDPNGSLTMRIADKVFRQLSQCKYVVTLHEFAIPSATMSCLYVGSDVKAFRDSAILASFLETDVVHTVLPEKNPLYWAHTLAIETALTRCGVACVTYEGAASSSVEITDHLACCLSEIAMSADEVLPQTKPVPFPTNRILARCETAGLFTPSLSCRINSPVDQNEILGELVTVPRFERTDCRAPTAGFLLQFASRGLLDTSMPFAAIGSQDHETAEMLSEAGLKFNVKPGSGRDASIEASPQ